MTKFEEEFKALTSWDWINVDLIQRILTRFGNWHSDGEFQELLSKYSGLNHNYEKEVIKSSKLESQIIGLKSQLQQQALPVVPDFVAKWYEKKKNKLEIAVYSINTSIDKKSFNDLTKIEKWFEGVENKPIETIFKMKDGYTVEKPKLFYLKHIDMSKRDKYNDYFAQIRNDRFEHNSVKSDTLPQSEIVGVRFTQSEIDSMQTGSYEQIEVVE